MKRSLLLLIAAIIVLNMSACARKIENNEKVDSAGNHKDEITSEVTETTDNNNETETIEETQASVNDGVIHVGVLKLDRYSVKLHVGESEMPIVTMEPENAENKNEIWSSDNESVATVSGYGKITGVSAGNCTVTVKSEDNPSILAKVTVSVEGTVSKSVSTPSSPTYIQGILIANKTYALPANYNPGIVPEAQSALNEMISAASKEGLNLFMASGFRSYERQQTLYNNYVAKDGKSEADRYSARPGHSEHQTGLAFDLNSVEESFGQTREGKWIAANCYKYGFILRYPANKEKETGYMYEPWHVRYLGKDIAKKVYDSGLCLEEYLNITSVYAN